MVLEKTLESQAQAGTKIAGRNINNLRYADDTTLMAEREEELKTLLMKVKEESKRTGLKLNIQKTKIMASSPITSWQIDGEKIETVTDLIFLRAPWTANPFGLIKLVWFGLIKLSILKEISPEYTLEGLMLKLQYFGHLMRRADSLEKTLMLGKIVGRRRRG